MSDDDISNSTAAPATEDAIDSAQKQVVMGSGYANGKAAMENDPGVPGKEIEKSDESQSSKSVQVIVHREIDHSGGAATGTGADGEGQNGVTTSDGPSSAGEDAAARLAAASSPVPLSTL